MQLIDFFNPTHFIGQGVIALLVLSFLTAPMGCFLIWRRMSFFGATLAHSALLGAVIGLLLGVGVFVGVMGFTALLACLLTWWLQNQRLANDTVLAMIAHLTLAIGVVAISLMDNLRIDLMAYLFGDVLSISRPVFYQIVAVCIVSAIALRVFWRGFVNLAVQPDIAQVEGYRTTVLSFCFVLFLSITISVGMVTVGALLIVSMLIIPAATARLIANQLKTMVFAAWIFTVISIISGMVAAYYVDLPAGPMVVIASGGLFVLAYLSAQWQQSRQ